VGIKDWTMNQLSLLSKARTALAQAKSLDDVKGIRDKAEAVRIYWKQAGESLEAQNEAAEIRILAERRAGQILSENVNRGRPKKNGSTMEPLLKAAGISNKQSHRWQREASVPDDIFAAHLAAIREGGKELTSSSVLKLAAPFTPTRLGSTEIKARGRQRITTIRR
jgi:hypothetical protein